VDSLVAFPEGESDPATVLQFLTWVVGRPPTTGVGGAYLWYRLLG
jgi:hypothetical protein